MRSAGKDTGGIKQCPSAGRKEGGCYVVPIPSLRARNHAGVGARFDVVHANRLVPDRDRCSPGSWTGNATHLGATEESPGSSATIFDGPVECLITLRLREGEPLRKNPPTLWCRLSSLSPRQGLGAGAA